MLLLLYCFLFIWMIIITSYFKLDPSLSIFDHMNSSGVENFFGQAQAQGFLNFFNPSPVSDLPSPNL